VSLEYWEGALLGQSVSYAQSADEIETPEIVSEYHYIQRYGLPWQGGSYDQPHFLMEILNVIENTKISVQKVAEANERVKNAKKSN
jgi:hypothetical protein